MRKYFSIIILVLLASCQSKDWKEELKNDLSDYKKSESILKSYSLKHNSGSDIELKLFKTNSNGFKKFIAEYKTNEVVDWTKIFFLKNDKLVYMKDFGISKTQGLEGEEITNPKYLLIERISFFKKDSTGVRTIREVELSELKNIESKTMELSKLEYFTSDLNKNDYNFSEIDYKSLVQ